MKGSVKKSKPASADDVPAADKVTPTKEAEPKVKVKEDESSVKVIENSTEESAKPPPEVPSATAEPTETEAVKQKVKKKKKITSSKTEELPIVHSEKTVESSLELGSLKSKVEDSSSQDSQKGSVESGTSETSNIVMPAPKDVTSSKSTGNVRTKKPPGDLSLNKIPPSSEKSEEVTSPTKTVERRRSKIFENSEQFNIFLRGSDSKSSVSDKPRKVFIPGVKVSDYKQAFERRSSLSSAASSSAIKPSASKKGIEQSSTNGAPKSQSNEVNSSPSEGLTSQDATELKSAETLEKNKSKEQVPVASGDATPKQASSDENSSVSIPKPEVSSETVGDRTGKEDSPKRTQDDDADLKLVPALEVTDKMSQQEKARIKKLKDAVDIISNAIAEETKKESGDSPPVRKISSTKPPVPGLTEKSKAKNASSSTKSPPTTPNEKKTVQTQPSSEVSECVEKLPQEREAAEKVSLIKLQKYHSVRKVSDLF